MGRAGASSFLANRRGIAATEFALIAPVLLILIFIGFSLFEVIRATYVADKATYTVGDLISRQTTTDSAQLAQIADVFRHLAIDHTNAPQLRITSLLRDEDGFSVDWTYSWPANGSLSERDIPPSSLPTVAVNDSVLLTETSVTVRPFLAIMPTFKGTTMTFEHEGATRPRFVGRLVRTD